MILRRETLALEDEIRARWRAWQARLRDPVPLLARANGWERLGEARVAERDPGEPLIRPPREREASPEAVSALAVNTPQAVLRDLHRPVSDFGVSELERIPFGWDPGARGATGEVRALATADYRVAVCDLLDGRRELAAIRADIAAKPWGQITGKGQDEGAR